MFWKRKKKPSDTSQLEHFLEKVSIGIEIGEAEAQLFIDYFQANGTDASGSEIGRLNEILESIPRIKRQIDQGFDKFDETAKELADFQKFLEQVEVDHQILEEFRKDEGVYGFALAGDTLDTMIEFGMGK